MTALTGYFRPEREGGCHKAQTRGLRLKTCPALAMARSKPGASHGKWKWEVGIQKGAPLHQQAAQTEPGGSAKPEGECRKTESQTCRTRNRELRF